MTRTLKQYWLTGIGLIFGLGVCLPAQAGEQVPLKGYFIPVATPAGPQPGCSGPNEVMFSIQATGQATQLGHFTGGSTTCLNVATLCYTGTFCWFSPDGRDSICGDFTGCFVPTGAPCAATNEESFTITGGSGRFEGATGGGSVGGQVNICTFGPSVVPFTGTVSRPHSPNR
jgi:hypothetical protein